MGTAVNVIAIIVILILVIVVVILLVGFGNKNNTGTTGKQCSYDSTCPTPDQSCVTQGGSPLGTCTNACLLDSDCWHGNYTGSATCANQNGNNVCVLATCKTSDNCTAGEACVTTNGSSSGQCVTIGLPLSNNSNKTIPIPCTGNSCYNQGSGLICNTDTASLPTPSTVWPCKTTSDCPTGLTCPSLGGYCGGGTNATVGYCVQCESDSNCPTGVKCTNGVC